MSTPLIALDEISRTFPGPPEVKALSPVSLTIPEGEFITISGPSGSGKSTLLNLLGLLDTASAGRYRFKGKDVGSLSERDRANVRGAEFGFVFQTFELLNHRPAIDSVVLPLIYRGCPIKQQRIRGRGALNRVGLVSKVDTTARYLSGGERQRVAIARAICGEPTVLLCDEPTGNLDSKNSAEIMRILMDMNAQGTTLIVITHNPSIAALGRMKLVIADGVVSGGSP